MSNTLVTTGGTHPHTNMPYARNCVKCGIAIVPRGTVPVPPHARRAHSHNICTRCGKNERKVVVEARKREATWDSVVDFLHEHDLSDVADFVYDHNPHREEARRG